MKPKTVLQNKVVGFSNKLKPITPKQKLWAQKKCFDSFAVISRRSVFCLECGHSWKPLKMNSQKVTFSCPCCNSHLKNTTSYSRGYKVSEYFAILTTVEDMQVIRMFITTKTMKKNKEAYFFVDEVMQHWIDQRGKVTVMSKNIMGLSQYYDQWIFQSNLEVRPYAYSPRYNTVPYKIYPNGKVLPMITRNGFKGHFYRFNPRDLFSLILREPKAETLLKAGQIGILSYHNWDAIREFWPSIKICIRNNYMVKDASIWLDYVSLLKHFQKDLNNPTLVCPSNLSVSHDRLVNKRKAQIKKQNFIDQQRQMEADQKEFEKQIENFLDLSFSDGQIQIVPLKSVEEFKLEGESLEHCVFANAYYKKVNSLVLSARIDNEPLETIEISLNDLAIVQARGKKNKATEYHERILNMVNANMPKIALRL